MLYYKQQTNNIARFIFSITLKYAINARNDCHFHEGINIPLN